MYIGIGPEAGKRVFEEDAFSYACERIYSGTEEEQETAMQIFREAENFYLRQSRWWNGSIPATG